jgi:hypothetical protein
MKNWKQLQVSDFVLEDPNWQPDRPATETNVLGHEVSVEIGTTSDVESPHLEAVKLCLESWEDNLKAIASSATEYISYFLPDKSIEPSEIMLFRVRINCNDEGNASEVQYLFKVGGSFEGYSAEQLMEFDDASTVEFVCPFDGKVVLWSDVEENVINDF